MSVYNDTYRNDIVVSGFINSIPCQPHTVIYHGGPWHGKREPYVPEKREMLVVEPFSRIHHPHPNETMLTHPKIVRYTPKTVKRVWDFRHSRRVLSGQVAVGCTWFGRVVREPTYETVIERITFAEQAIAMVAEGWKDEPVMQEKDYYGREIVHVEMIFRGEHL